MNWISVEDELPKPTNSNEMFACVFKNTDGYRGVSAFYFIEARNEFFASHDFVTITHWMPLPAPPALCEICNGTGIIFIGCCSGNQCGCMGQPVAAKKCKCGKQIDESKMTNDEVFIFEHVEYLEDTP